MTQLPELEKEVESAPRSVFDRVPAILRDVAFRRYWSAQTISYMGDQVTTVALPLIAVLTLNVTPFQMGLLAAAQLVPNLLISLHAGAWVDRHGRRARTMIAMDVGRAVLLASVPVAYVLDALSLAQLFVVTFLIGCMGVVFNLAAQGLFTAVVPREKFLEANSLTRGSFSFSWVAGPGLAGSLVQILSAPVVILADVVSFLGSALLLRGVRAKEPEGDKDGGGNVREGLAFVRRTPALRAKFVAGTSLNFFYTVYFTLLLLYAARELGLPAGLIGLALSAGAVGALLGSVLANKTVRRIGLGTSFVLGSLLYPAALALVPLAGGDQWTAFALLTIAEFVSGAGLMLLDISGATLQQAITPDRFRSRVQGAYMTVSFGTRPLGSVAAGGLAEVFGLRPVLGLAVAGGVLSVLPLLRSPIPRMRELPDEAK
ncbi:MFS transporter [Spirillospora sp. CA-255316]